MKSLKIKHKNEVYTFNRVYYYGIHYLMDRDISGKKIFFCYDLTFDICSSSMGMVKEYEFSAGYCWVGKTYEDIPIAGNRKVLIKSTYRSDEELSICKTTQKEFLGFCERNLYLMLSTMNIITK